jgi:hypothetical protein
MQPSIDFLEIIEIIFILCVIIKVIRESFKKEFSVINPINLKGIFLILLKLKII